MPHSTTSLTPAHRARRASCAGSERFFPLGRQLSGSTAALAATTTSPRSSARCPMPRPAAPRSTASAQLAGFELRPRHCARRTRPRLASARMRALACSCRRAPALGALVHSTGHVCTVCRAPRQSLVLVRSDSGCAVCCVRRALRSHAVRSTRRRPGSARTYCSHVIRNLAVISPYLIVPDEMYDLLFHIRVVCESVCKTHRLPARNPT